MRPRRSLILIRSNAAASCPESEWKLACALNDVVGDCTAERLCKFAACVVNSVVACLPLALPAPLLFSLAGDMPTSMRVCLFTGAQNAGRSALNVDAMGVRGGGRRSGGKQIPGVNGGEVNEGSPVAVRSTTIRGTRLPSPQVSPLAPGFFFPNMADSPGSRSHNHIWLRACNTLNITPETARDPDAVKAAYLRLVKETHPDVVAAQGDTSKADALSERFRNVQSAYRTLTTGTVPDDAARVVAARKGSPHAARWEVRARPGARPSASTFSPLIFCAFSLLAGTGIFSGAMKMHQSMYGPREDRYRLHGGGSSIYRPPVGHSRHGR